MPPRLNFKPGTSGTPIKVITNSFEVKSLPQGKVYHYDVEFLPNEKDKDKEKPTRPPKREFCFSVVNKLQLTYHDVFNPRAAYDGQRSMFRATPLKINSNAATFEVKSGAKGPKARSTNVKISLVAVIEPQSLINVVQGRSPHNSQSLTTIAMLNVFVKMKAVMMYPSNTRSFFTKSFRDTLGGGLEIWQGLYQSVRPTIGRVIINVDVASAVFYSGGPLVELVRTYLNVLNVKELTPGRNPLMDRKLRQLKDFIGNLEVYTTVPTYNPPRYRKIRNVIMTGADDYKFDMDTTGENMSVTDYYLKTYNYRMEFGKIICVGIREAVYPLEVLSVREGQFYRKFLHPSVAPRALQFSTKRPSERIKIIEKSRDILGYDDSDYLRLAGIKIDNQLLQVDGRVLAPPSIQWGGQNTRPDNPRGGAWNLIGKMLQNPQAIKAWAVVVYDKKISPESGNVEKFLGVFVDTCQKLGMSFPRDRPPILKGRLGVPDDKVHQDMEDAGKKAMEVYNAARPCFILSILPSAPDVRIAIKHWGECIRGVVTQCMSGDKVARANAQYCANLALKVNVKLGGVNSTLANGSAVMNLLAKEPTMIIGADVSHSAPSIKNTPSIVGFVSSVDDKFSRWVASTGLQQPRLEIILKLDELIEKAIRTFFEYWAHATKKGILPSRIIFYRDGVSEGEISDVSVSEIKVLKDSLERVWKAQKFKPPIPKLTFIIVGKKHHVRFFPKDGRDADRSGNCPAGLVVDTGIVNPVDYDFYLQSHAGLLGTSRPSHYIVVEDENAFGPDMLQGISYALCHVYARATRSVSIPAPIYYADLVAGRARIHSRLIREGGETMSSGSQPDLDEHLQAFKPVVENLKRSMYFM